MEIPLGMCLVCEQKNKMWRCVDVTGGGTFHGICLECRDKYIKKNSQPKYTFKYASASFTMTIMDVIRQRGITLRNVGPETAEFLRKLTNAANGGERLQEMIAALDPYYESYQGDIYCFFCSAFNNDEHRDDCAWKIAKRNILHGFLP